MTPDELQTLIDDASADYALGDTEASLEKLARATAEAPGSFEAWHALAEIRFALRQLDGALEAAERARTLRPGDMLIHATLSRVWMERGDKAQAEHFGGQARMLSWKDELSRPASDGASDLH